MGQGEGGMTLILKSNIIQREAFPFQPEASLLRKDPGSRPPPVLFSSCLKVAGHERSIILILSSSSVECAKSLSFVAEVVALRSSRPSRPSSPSVYPPLGHLSRPLSKRVMLFVN